MPTEPEPLTAVARPLTGQPFTHQSWRDLTMVHWAVDPSAVRRFMPPGVEPDVWEGRTFVGLVPFRMVDVAVAGPPLPGGIGTFLETNVRLYSVDASGRRGVVFVSLDAERLAFVTATRATTGLPYRWATMRHEHSIGRDGADEHRYVTHLRGLYRHVRSVVRTRVLEPMEPGPLELFLTARWGLHAQHLGRTWFLPNEHEPWPLHRAEVEVADDLVPHAGIVGTSGRAPDHVLFSPGVTTRFGPPVRVDRASRTGG